MVNTLELSKKIRQHAIRMVCRAKASHISSALSIADILAVLYGGFLNVDPQNPQFCLRDRFILSKGHSCVAVYAALAECGFFDLKLLDSYGDDFSWLMNHISHHVPGVELSTGSLGHGLPFGVGKALAANVQGESWRTVVLLSDGEMDEGSNWEALMFASHHKLNKLVAIIDYNKLQSLDTIEKTLGLEPLADKLSAFGCKVTEIDGHNHKQIANALMNLDDQKPLAVIAHTTKGKGISFMEGRVEWHYKNPNNEQMALAILELEASHA